jgi:hypothetical protein
MLLSELMCNDLPQGVIAVSTKHRESQLNAEHQVLYVEYLENAPWNIKGNATGVSAYLGVGLLLIAESIGISLDRGLNGRIGLHSLPLAEPFYRDKCLFSELGPDVAENGLVYFECTEQQAMSHLHRVEGFVWQPHRRTHFYERRSMKTEHFALLGVSHENRSKTNQNPRHPFRKFRLARPCQLGPLSVTNLLRMLTTRTSNLKKVIARRNASLRTFEEAAH